MKKSLLSIVMLIVFAAAAFTSCGKGSDLRSADYAYVAYSQQKTGYAEITDPDEIKELADICSNIDYTSEPAEIQEQIFGAPNYLYVEFQKDGEIIWFCTLRGSGAQIRFVPEFSLNGWHAVSDMFERKVTDFLNARDPGLNLRYQSDDSPYVAGPDEQ